MPNSHPILPDHRPLAIAHRGANSASKAQHAIELGADMLELDIWPRLWRLEVRHDKTIGPLPIFWEKWRIERFGGRPPELQDILEATPVETRLFLDLKGSNPNLGQRVVSAVTSIQPGRDIILCGRAWRQLDRVEPLEHVNVFYSVGTEDELAGIWPRLESQAAPAISIHHGLLTEPVLARLANLRTTVIAWTVNDLAIAKSLFERGVDGFTSDDDDLITQIVQLREHAFDDDPEARLPRTPQEPRVDDE
ncbi:MAG TPA: glycerophosphodiester phosphodiesterase [Thermomicrobiales bacterium]|nr:glycerophosphodiester phosphodiesterase [Thermomicrobiales bacterium]